MYHYKCKIIRVIDGDTVVADIDLGFSIVLSNQSVRLAGIDAPEMRTTDVTEKIFGTITKNKVEEKLVAGQFYSIKTTKPENDDKFGRVIGEFILTDGSSLNKWLIENNYAVAYSGQARELLTEAHQANRIALIARGEA